MRSLRLMRARPVATALRSLKPLRVGTVAKRSLATSAEEKAKLIANFPYAWPWGKTIEVDTPKRKLKIEIAQDAPASKQHKLAYKIDVVPPEVPPQPTYFVGPVGKATHALFNGAEKAGTLDATKEALDKFATAYDGNPKIKIQLMNPNTSVEDKLAFIRELSASASADEALTATLVQLFKDKKLQKVGEMNKNYSTLLSEYRKERHGAIISAEPLSDKHYDAITAKMQKLVKSDEKLIVSREVEPSLVGGFIIRIGNRAQDLSVASQIQRMEDHLKQFFAKNKDAADKVLA